jgi:hypothetical protein
MRGEIERGVEGSRSGSRVAVSSQKPGALYLANLQQQRLFRAPGGPAVMDRTASRQGRQGFRLEPKAVPSSCDSMAGGATGSGVGGEGPG